MAKTGANALKKRIVGFQKLISEKKIDVALISCLSNNDRNLRYFTGQDIDAGLLIIPKAGSGSKGKIPVFLASKMEYGRARRFVKCCKVLRFEKPVTKQISDLIKKYRPRTIGVNKGIMPVNEYIALKKTNKKRKFVDIGKLLLEERRIKDGTEVRAIEKACKVSDEVFKRTFKSFKTFKTEEDVRKFMEKETRERGCNISFEPLVASGANSGLPHYMGENVKLKKGFCFIDFGVDYVGYKSDTTRAVYIGKPTKRDLLMYALVLSVQKRAVEMVKPGVKCADIYNSVNKWLGKYKKNFTHNLGHGVGIEIHELPNLSGESRDMLKPGMAITIEPGVYFEDKYGIRIEDTVLVTENGHKVLTKTGKDLLLIR